MTIISLTTVTKLTFVWLYVLYTTFTVAAISSSNSLHTKSKQAHFLKRNTVQWGDCGIPVVAQLVWTNRKSYSGCLIHTLSILSHLHVSNFFTFLTTLFFHSFFSSPGVCFPALSGSQEQELLLSQHHKWNTALRITKTRTHARMHTQLLSIPSTIASVSLSATVSGRRLKCKHSQTV